MSLCGWFSGCTLCVKCSSLPRLCGFPALLSLPWGPRQFSNTLRRWLFRRTRSLAYLQAAGGDLSYPMYGDPKTLLCEAPWPWLCRLLPRSLSPTFLALALNLRAPPTITFILEPPSSFYTSLTLENLLPSKASLRPPWAAHPTLAPAKMVPKLDHHQLPVTAPHPTCLTPPQANTSSSPLGACTSSLSPKTTEDNSFSSTPSSFSLLQLLPSSPCLLPLLARVPIPCHLAHCTWPAFPMC